jgi:hypothetical protein
LSVCWRSRRGSRVGFVAAATRAPLTGVIRGVDCCTRELPPKPAFALPNPIGIDCLPTSGINCFATSGFNKMFYKTNDNQQNDNKRNKSSKRTIKTTATITTRQNAIAVTAHLRISGKEPIWESTL